MVQELIDGQITLTLATTGKSGPWSAPVYYVFFNRRFFFFSSPQSRHIRQSVEHGTTAASIFHQADSWQDIRGIQMRGVIERIVAIQLSMKVIAAYLKRFAFTREFFGGRASPDLSDFYSHFKARLYAFIPTTIYYTDNRFGFGSRQRVDWHATHLEGP